MTYKTILLHIDGDPTDRAPLDAALALTAAFEAHLVGLHVVPAITIATYMAVQVPPQLVEEQRAHAERLAREAESVFRTAAEAAGVSHEWRVVEEIDIDAAGMVASHGRYADLLVFGRGDPDGLDDNRLTIERALFESGRPLLVVPPGNRAPVPGRGVMIAWNGSRESVRATHDALPFLRAAESVSVVTVNPDGQEGPLPGADIATVLARHDVTARAEAMAGADATVPDLVLSRIAETGADLLVMGAYGRSRLREMILGGMTRHMLREATVPVLFAH